MPAVRPDQKVGGMRLGLRRSVPGRWSERIAMALANGADAVSHPLHVAVVGAAFARSKRGHANFTTKIRAVGNAYQ